MAPSITAITGLLGGFGGDVRYAARQVRGHPTLAGVIVASLALGIGANTAVFSLVNAVVLGELGVADPGRLVAFQYTDPEAGLAESLQHSHSGRGSRDREGREVNLSISWPAYQSLRVRATSVSDLVGFVPLGLFDRPAAVVDGEPQFLDVDMVTANYFPALGVSPVVGRAIVPDDERPGAPRVGVISDRFWNRAFGRSLAALGRTILVNGVPVTVVGMAPPSFAGLEIGRSPDLWIQMGPQQGLTPWGVRTAEPPEAVYAAPDRWWIEVVARLRPGVSIEEARRELDRLFREHLVAGLEPMPPPEKIPSVRLTPAAQALNIVGRRFSTSLRVLMAAVALVLLVACANVATLLLARATTRRGEMAVRLALGAPRARLVRQLLAEAALYAAAGGAAGLVLAAWGSRLLLGLLTRGRDPVPIDVGFDPFVLAFTGAIAVLTTLAFGMAPALCATRLDLGRDLTERMSTARRGGRLRALSGINGLVVAQIALSLPLVVGAGLFLRTVGNLEREPLGFDPDRLLVFRVDPTKAGFRDARLIEALDETQRRIGLLPGVRGVTASRLGLITGWMSNGSVSIDGEPPGGGPGGRSIHWNQVAPGFSETLGMPLLVGRALDERDAAAGSRVAVINEAMVRRCFPGGSPIGRRFWFGRTREGEPIEVVGVVGDAKYASLRAEAPPTAYVPHTQNPASLSAMTFQVRAAGDPLALVPAVRRIVSDVTPGVAIDQVGTQARQIADSLGAETMYARLFTLFGASALLLAAFGLYGSLSYTLARRTREIGVRMALGAARGRVLGEALGGTAVVVACGAAAGGLLAWGGARFVRTLLFGVTPFDAPTVALAVVVMAAVAAAAAYLPARRASRLDPLSALREE